jgi:hypothetical protein
MLNEMARALLEYETIDGAEVELICAGGTLKRAAPPAPTSGTGNATTEKSEAKEPKKGEGTGSAAPLPA